MKITIQTNPVPGECEYSVRRVADSTTLVRDVRGNEVEGTLALLEAAGVPEEVLARHAYNWLCVRGHVRPVVDFVGGGEE